MNIIATDCKTHIRLLVDGRVDSNTTPQLQQAILNAFQKNHHVVVDFLNVPTISSAGLRALLIGHKTALSKKGDMTITNLSPAVRQVLDITGMSAMFHIV